MIRSLLKEIIDDCFNQGVREGDWSDNASGKYTIEVPKHENQGDFSTNIALVVAGIEKRNPREIAAQFVSRLEREDHLVASLAIAGPGFVNITIQKSRWQELPGVVERLADQFGRGDIGQGRRVMVEFVSANPTGPLSVGHGRQAILGDAIARLLEATGHDVYREYYYNNAGRQMRVLGQSVRARYRELCGVAAAFPEDGYQGDYIVDIARSLFDDIGDSLAESCGSRALHQESRGGDFQKYLLDAEENGNRL